VQNGCTLDEFMFIGSCKTNRKHILQYPPDHDILMVVGCREVVVRRIKQLFMLFRALD